MCFNIPNGTECKARIQNRTCTAIMQKDPVCRSSQGGSLINIVTVENLIRAAIKEKKYPQ